jgi:uncharacterized protein DUF2842
MHALSPHRKKLIGTIGLLLWLPAYALLALRIGIAVLPNAASAVMLLYYAIAGTAWIIPVGLLLPWMHREPVPFEVERAHGGTASQK